MYLKNIEIHGFKSFAKKIHFDFHEGITGIVGPNGSGKSNVADAVRWVFGEQKVKQLRGGSMQDVIFSGTEMRKPLSYASVSITLDNSDHQLPVEYEEVTITRRLYRSGESEYGINGSTCRLKDINELFYDTGIGKEGYSIIGQGQIDKILSGKPEERRELFDEAVGIVKFKRRKNMSVKKLEDERQNLTRVKDILAEIEKQVGPLERQSKIAKEYLAKKDELKIYDINMFLLETERIKSGLQELDEKINIVTEEYEAANLSYETMKEEYEAAEIDMDEVQVSIDKAKQQLNDTTILKQQLEGRIEVLKEQINTVKMNDEHITQRLFVIQKELEEKEVLKNNTQKELDEIQLGLKVERDKVSQAKSALVESQTNIIMLNDDIDAKKQEIIDVLNNRASTKVKIQRYDTMLEQSQIRKSELNRKLIEVQTEKTLFVTELEGYKANLQLAVEEVAKIQNKMDEVEKSIITFQNVITNQTNVLRNDQSTYHKEQSRLDSLKNITERYDGYGNSIRRVMERKSQMPGLLGVVADIIKTEKKYEIAVETALGGSIQNIVTSDEATAKQMVQYLKQNKYGRATFLPLTSIKGGTNIRYPEALKEEGVIGLASTLVDVEDNYRNLSESLLGRTVVTTTIDVGIALGKKYQHSLRIVTLEGELLNPGGAITGGAFKNTSNLLSRRREIEDLELLVEQLKQQMIQSEDKLEDAKKKRSDAYGILDMSKDEHQKKSMELNTLKMNVSQMQEKIESINTMFTNIKQENSELDEQNDNIIQNVDSIQLELECSESLEIDIKQQIEAYQVTLEELKDAEVLLVKQHEDIQLSCASSEQKFEFAKLNLERIQEEIQKFDNELQLLDTNKGDASDEIDGKNREIENLQLTILESKELFDEIDSSIENLMAQKEELSNKHKAIISNREQLSKRISDLDKETFRLQSKKENLEETEEKHINYMWDEYELTYNFALEIKDDTLTDLEFMKRRIKDLKNEIKSLGSVNVNAIEDYKEISERHIFLRTQHDDLIEAEKTLMQIIDEIDIAMREQFKSKFEIIANEYDKVFKQLFGGGKGTLELMENEDILEAGVRIIAQPPGKKLQNMMQLSGGEKALTAISLLFAIQNLKPSPFCLLDEIEAALDDSNVSRFAQYLHKLTKHTQFIVITHRRGTMTAADRLYGITMQEKGVSTLVSVDLLQDELDK